MYQRRIITLTVVLVLLFTGQAMSQTKVLGLFQLGKSTYDEVKGKLPKSVKITSDDRLPTDSYGGPTILTEGTGYGIAGLKIVQFNFDSKQILANIGMLLEGRRFDDVKKILLSRYQQIHSYPGVWLLFKKNRYYVYLYLPGGQNGDNIDVEYMTDTVYYREKLRERQTVEDKKALERREQKRLERKLAEEAEKF